MASGQYGIGSLIEWGSITKGLVGTAACRSLDVEQPVADLLPEYRGAHFTVDDLVRHTSGLARVSSRMTTNPFRDPYRPTVGARLEPADIVSVMTRGEYSYSNLGYALLGEALDRVHGDWFEAVREQVLEPAGITSATTAPRPEERVVPRVFGRRIRPWQITGSPYAASGGMWSTFDDLCRYADWALADNAEPERTVSWLREGATTWINGEVRASGAAIVRAQGVTAVVHALAQRPHAADRLALTLIKCELRGQG